MFYYFLIFIILIIPIFVDNGKYNKRNSLIYYIVLPLFICFGYMVGSDWRGYELQFNNLNSIADSFETYNETGYYLLGYLFKYLGLSFWEYSILIKVIGYFIFLNFYRKYSNHIYGIVFFFVYVSIVLWIDHPARNFCAVIIYLFSIKYLHQRQLFKYIIICILASLFHLSALFLIPIFFLYRNYSNKQLVLIAITAISLIFLERYLFSFITEYLMQSFTIHNRLNPYLEDGHSMTLSSSLIGLFLHIIIISLVIYNRQIIETTYKYGYLFIFLSVIYFIFLVIGVVFPIFFRFNLYYVIPYSVMIGYLISVQNKKMKFPYVGGLILIFGIILFRSITSSYKYIPYSHYFEYVLKEKPSFYYRSFYNLENSPYKKQ